VKKFLRSSFCLFNKRGCSKCPPVCTQAPRRWRCCTTLQQHWW